MKFATLNPIEREVKNMLELLAHKRLSEQDLDSAGIRLIFNLKGPHETDMFRIAKGIIARVKGQSTKLKKSLPTVHLTENWYLDYIKNSNNFKQHI